MDKKSKARGLGRGLSALMADVAPQGNDEAAAPARRADLLVPVEKVQANPNQPRRRFTAGDLEDLTASIKQKGVLQPLIVRPIGDRYEIVAGERRWRAAQQAQLHEIPVLVRELDDAEVLEIAIVENIQRADLNAVEEAAGYRQLMDVFGHTQEKMAEVLGKSRSHIANLLRLLSLPEDVQDLVREGKLSSGHARALITAEDPLALARQVMAQGLSVRATEKLAKAEKQPASKTRTERAGDSGQKDADTKALEGDLSAALGMSVLLTHKPGDDAGQMVIRYKSLEQLDNLCRLLSGD